MNPPPPLALRKDAPRDAMAFAIEHLWPAIDVEHDSPLGRAIETALLEPARSMLERAGKRFRGHLVELCWQLGGGEGACPDALPAVIEVIHAGSLIVDDIEDDSPERRGAPTVHRLFGVPLALNAGNWLYFWSLELLRELELPAEVELDLHRRLGRMLVQGHAGQAVDLDTDVAHLRRREVPAHVEAMSRLKTGSFMSLAAAVGAVAARAPREIADALETFGMAVGQALQMLDDLGNLVARREGAKRYEDLRHGKANWPWAWFAEVAGPVEWRHAQARLAALRSGTMEADPIALDLLERVGLLGRQRVHQLLATAFADLKAVTGNHPLLAALRAEMERLENSYV
ncbi:MAG: polyprenyl synthetase family protein [Planctomycetota bacterium]|nr:polyprenyl synthetase family protein [Planctomycetota bacterium]